MAQIRVDKAESSMKALREETQCLRESASQACTKEQVSFPLVVFLPEPSTHTLSLAVTCLHLMETIALPFSQSLHVTLIGAGKSTAVWHTVTQLAAEHNSSCCGEPVPGHLILTGQLVG